MLQTKAVEKITAHILRSVMFFSENRAVYETMWRMRYACWITKAADTLRICNTY